MQHFPLSHGGFIGVNINFDHSALILVVQDDGNDSECQQVRILLTKDESSRLISSIQEHAQSFNMPGKWTTSNGNWKTE